MVIEPIEPIQTLEPEQPPRRNWIFLNERGIRSGWRLLVWFVLSLAGLVAVMFVIGVDALLSGARLHPESVLSSGVLRVATGLCALPILLAAAVVAHTMEHRPVFNSSKRRVDTLVAECR